MLRLRNIRKNKPILTYARFVLHKFTETVCEANCVFSHNVVIKLILVDLSTGEKDTATSIYSVTFLQYLLSITNVIQNK